MKSNKQKDLHTAHVYACVSLTKKDSWVEVGWTCIVKGCENVVVWCVCVLWRLCYIIHQQKESKQKITGRRNNKQQRVGKGKSRKREEQLQSAENANPGAAQWWWCQRRRESIGSLEGPGAKHTTRAPET